jgi:hypothetical protein
MIRKKNSRSLRWMRHAIAQPIEYTPEAPDMGRCAPSLKPCM